MTPTRICIRPYTQEDWDAVCLVHDRARPFELECYVPREAIRPMEEEAEADGFFDSQTFVAVTGDSERIIGFICIQPPELTWLYVDPDFHRQGVARSLVQHVLPVLGPDAFVLCTTQNPGALAAYESFGFTVAARFPGETHGYPCDAVRMCLPGSRHRDRPPKPYPTALRLAGSDKDDPGRPVRDEQGVWLWVGSQQEEK